MQTWNWVFGIAAALTLSSATAAPAEACSYAEAGWFVSQQEPVVASPTGPFVVLLQGYSNPSENLAPLETTMFDVVVTDAAGDELPGTQAVIGGQVNGGEPAALGRISWTPTSSLSPGANYTMTVTPTSDATSGGPADITLSPRTLTPTQPAISSLAATEYQTAGGDRQCCDAAAEADSACFTDDCGGFEFGGSCRVCWNTAYAYPVRVTLDWEALGDVPTNYYGYRVVEVNEIDDEIGTLAEGDLASPTLIFDLPPGADDEFVGIRLELVDVTDGGAPTATETAFLVERDTSGDIQRIEHSAPNNQALWDRCESGTYEVVHEDGTTEPIADQVVMCGQACVDKDAIDAALDDDADSTNGSDSKGDAGGCSSAGGSGSLASLLIGLIGIVVRRRR